MKEIILVCLTIVVTSIEPTPVSKASNRKDKSLAYYDYMVQPEELEYQNYAHPNEDYPSPDYEENNLSRTIPTPANNRKRIPAKEYDSPIYYIRLPPQPYMYVPGLGYMPQQPQRQAAANQLLNLPVDFLSNGKPSLIYQWHGGINQFPADTRPLPPSTTTTTTTTPKPVTTKRVTSKPHTKFTDSTIHRLKGKYVFNGKPNGIYLLNEKYNSLYGDALQHFYP